MPGPPCAQGRRVRACGSLLAAPGPARSAEPSSATALWTAVSGQASSGLTCLLCPGTGRGKDTPAGGDEDSGARSAGRPALAQCRALSVDWAGPGSPHRLYLTVQVSPGALRNVPGGAASALALGASAAGAPTAPPGKEAPGRAGDLPRAPVPAPCSTSAWCMEQFALLVYLRNISRPRREALQTLPG